MTSPRFKPFFHHQNSRKYLHDECKRLSNIPGVLFDRRKKIFFSTNNFLISREDDIIFYFIFYHHSESSGGTVDYGILLSAGEVSKPLAIVIATAITIFFLVM